MKRHDRCSSRKAGNGCLSSTDIQTVQPFPTGGRLGANLGLPLPLLTARLGLRTESSTTSGEADS